MIDLFGNNDSPPLVSVRDYQEDAAQAMIRAWKDCRSTILQMATALGKTRTAARVIELRKDSGDSLFLVNRDQLLEQAVATFRQLLPGYGVGIEQADRYSQIGDNAPKVVVASKDTLYKPHRLERLGENRFATIIPDECHAVGRDVKSWVNILNYFGSAKVGGITATPERTDGMLIGEGCPFESVCFQMDIADGIAQGWITPVQPKYAYVEGYDISQVEAGDDLNQEQLDRVMSAEKPLVGVCQAAIDFSENGRKQTIIFCTSVAHAERVAEMLNRWNVRKGTGVATSVSCYDGSAEDRRQIFRLFRKGDIRYLTNFGIVGEGVDLPTAEVGILARATKVHRLYVQWVGRFIRPDENIVGLLNAAANAEERRAIIARSPKPAGVIVDLVGVTGQHKLVTVIDIFAPKDTPEPVKTRAKKLIEEGVVDDAQEALKEAQDEWDGMREEARQGVLVAAHLHVQDIDPYAVFDAKAMKKMSTKKVLPATEAQKAAMERDGFSKQMINTVGFAEARKLLDWITDRNSRGLSTIPQMRTLRRFGYDPAKMSKQLASELIENLRNNGWKR